MTRGLTVNVDLDGVVYDLDYVIQLNAPYIFNEPDLELDDTKWDYGLGQEKMSHFFLDGILRYEIFRTGPEIPDAVASIKQLAGEGHRIRFVSNKVFASPWRSYKAQQQTLSWLLARALLGPEYEVAFTRDKQGYLADVVIDDKPDLSWTQRGALNLLFDQPWNREVYLHHELYPIARAKGWEGVLNLIRESEEL